MTRITKNTCATCISFNEGAEYACSNLVSFDSRQPRSTDSCPDHEQRVVSLYRHPDSYSAINIEQVHGETFSHGILIAVDENGKTVRVPIGQLGLIEVGLEMARIGKTMIYS